MEKLKKQAEDDREKLLAKGKGMLKDFSESDGKPYSRGGVSGSTLSALREEYEEQLQAMNDEKRELMMKNSAAITDESHSFIQPMKSFSPTVVTNYHNNVGKNHQHKSVQKDLDIAKGHKCYSRFL